LFNLFIEKVVNYIKFWLVRKEIALKIVGICIPMLRFADDIVVIAISEVDLQTVLNVMNTTFKEYSLKINSASTKTLVYYKKT